MEEEFVLSSLLGFRMLHAASRSNIELALLVDGKEKVLYMRTVRVFSKCPDIKDSPQESRWGYLKICEYFGIRKFFDILRKYYIVFNNRLNPSCRKPLNKFSTIVNRPFEILS